jgi:tryptophan synthase alpha chain
MSRIKKAFEDKKAFIGFVTGGDPTIAKTKEFIMEMVRAGADLIEIGIPFSDPIAEGSVIQEANLRALANGTTTDKLFEMVAELRKETDVPMVFLTYLNPVYKYGYERFSKRCQEAGIDGLIIPDLPYEEKQELAVTAQAYDVDLISLIAPTSQERIQKIAKDASGFLYVVSSMGVTGVRNEITTDLKDIIEMIRKVTDIPAAIGFGINTPVQAKEMAKTADGAIVGSAIVKIIAEYKEKAGKPIYEYVKNMKKAVLEA